MEKQWEQAEIQCPGCHDILVLRASLHEIWCPWCEEPYEIREIPHQTDPTRIVLILTRKTKKNGQT